MNWGLDNLESGPKITEEDRKNAIILEDSFFNCFNTEFGKKVLDHLEKKFLKLQAHFPEMGDAGVYFTYSRGGQIAMYNYILKKIESSKKRRN